MKGFTGIKDLDLKILMDVDDETLLNACSTNKELYRICNTDSFWRNRYVKQYGEEATKYKPEKRSWKNHYMQTYIDLHRFEDPMNFFSVIAWKSNLDDSFFVDHSGQQIRVIPLKEAPEWVMNNLWLLKIREVKIASTTYNNITPIQLLKNFPARENLYLYRFGKIPTGKYLTFFSSLPIIRTLKLKK